MIENKKKRPGRPAKKDKRIRISFMGLESYYKRAVENHGKEALNAFFENRLIEAAIKKNI